MRQLLINRLDRQVTHQRVFFIRLRHLDTLRKHL